jgi:hypothetical protein
MCPFTYIIIFKPTGQFYYGVRYAKNCHPSDLWTTYYTSSSYIKQLIVEHGKDAFDFEIRKRFASSKKARLWELKVLKRMKVTKHSLSLNKTDTTLINFAQWIWVTKKEQNKFVDILELQKYLSEGWATGRYFSPDHRRKNSEGVKRYASLHGSPLKGKSLTPELKKKMSEQRKGKRFGTGFVKPITLDGIFYTSIKDAVLQTGLTRYQISLKLNANLQLP